MKPGDLMETAIRRIPVILLRKEAKHVWAVVTPEGLVESMWTLNLLPIVIEIDT